MARVTTLSDELVPLMDGTSITAPYCVVCGRTGVLNQHHVVRRGAGRLFRDGVEVPKPTLTLCGMGNASGCHGLAHQNRLHFRWARVTGMSDASYAFGSGHWEYLVTDVPTKYHEALKMNGWRPIHE